MSFHYAVIGSGRQGTASAYDLSIHGQASQIIMIDRDERTGRSSAARINRLVGRKVAKAFKLDIRRQTDLEKVLETVDACVSAVPYNLNLSLTESSIRTKTHMTDMGGNAEMVSAQMKLSREAQKAGISIVPDCGMGPGMTGSLAAYGIDQMDKAVDVFIWDGGLPQKPKPPWNYKLTFHVNGLTNEYFGMAAFLREGQVVKVPCFTEHELLDFPPLGQLEAFVASGGTSTAIHTYKGKLRTYQNKTLRYPGHCEQFHAYQMLGLFEPEPMIMGQYKIIPREFFHTLLEPKVKAPDDFKDICLIRVIVRGLKKGQPHEFIIDLVDKADKKTGFTSMERVTGWHAAIILEIAAQGKARKGVIPLEKAVDPAEFVAEAKRRGFKIKERIKKIKRL